MPKQRATPELIDSVDQLLENVRRFATTDKPDELREHRLKMLARGRNLVLLRADGESLFAPSRFAGYKGAKLEDYVGPEERDGKLSTPRIDRLLFPEGIRQIDARDGVQWEAAEAEFLRQCGAFGVRPAKYARSYWVVDRDGGQGLSAKSSSRRGGGRKAPRDSARQQAHPIERDIDALLDGLPVNTETLAMVAARIGQGRFRDAVSKKWDDRCAVTGCSVREALRASHIKPWAESSDRERLDPHNGILLAAHIDALFDRYLISFKDNGRIVVSSLLKPSDLKALGINADWRLSKPLSSRQKAYLKLHRREQENREWD